MFTQPPTKRRGFYILCKKFAFWRKLLYNICRQQKHKQIQHVANSTMLKKFFTSPRSIPIWFLAVILVGSALLSLPISSVASPPKYIDALFTSVSAVCVTGLITVDTATQWSLFGQIVILLLLQIGGMGVVTIAMVFHLIFHQHIGLGQRNLMQESISAHELGGIVRFTRFIIVGILTVELVGAIAMCPIFIADFGWGEGIWKAIFHSVSAFCNAGFDIMGTTEAKFVSLTRYVANPVINITVIMLIVAGGIGLSHLARHRQKRRTRQTLPHSKQVDTCYYRDTHRTTGRVLLFCRLWQYAFRTTTACVAVCGSFTAYGRF